MISFSKQKYYYFCSVLGFVAGKLCFKVLLRDLAGDAADVKDLLLKWFRCSSLELPWSYHGVTMIPA